MRKILLFTALCSLMLVLSLDFVSCQDKKTTTDQIISPEDLDITLDEIISNCTEALGGADIINNITTLRVGAVFPDHGNHSLYFEMKRPNLNYSPQSKIVFDGERACWMKGPNGNSAPQLVDEAEWVDFEVENARYFPAFFDYPSELLGKKVVEGNEFYLLKIDLPLGAQMTYKIDAQTFLPVKAAADFEINGDEIHSWRDLSDYREVEGFLYPHGFTYGSRTGRQNGTIESVEINPEFSENKFVVPIGVNK